MKQVITVAIAFFAVGIFALSAFAQYEQGKSLLGPRLGIGVHGSNVAVGAGYEYGVTPEISVGGLIDYYQWSYDVGFGYSGKYKYVIIGAQGNYHFGKLLKWETKLDPFAGLVLGYENISWSWSGPSYFGYSPSASAVVLGGQAGIRYFFSPTVALYGQAGFGITYLKVGVDFKF